MAHFDLKSPFTLSSKNKNKCRREHWKKLPKLRDSLLHVLLRLSEGPGTLALIVASTVGVFFTRFATVLGLINILQIPGMSPG